MSFCSLRAKVDNEFANAKLGVYTFSILGVVHNSIATLIPEVGEQRFVQIYIHDGTVGADQDDDKSREEIYNFQEARYVSACEACYGTFSFEIHALLGCHSFGEYADWCLLSELPILILVGNVKCYTLMVWFLANQKFPLTRDSSYLNFPNTYFVRDKTKREWKERVKGFVSMIGRVYSAYPGKRERFYMRIILNQVSGYTSFGDIRDLLDGITCSTFNGSSI